MDRERTESKVSASSSTERGRSDRQLGAEVDDEIRFHLEMRARDLERRGWTSERAWAEAVRRFGDVAATRAVCVASDARKERRMLRREVMREAVQDLSHGVRQLRRQPAFAALAVLTLAVGIGAATAIYSVTHHVLLRPLPYEAADRVVTLWETRAHAPGAALEVAPGNFLDWQERLATFESLGLAEPWGFDWSRPDGPPVPLRAWAVSARFMDALGVRPLLGRSFAPEEYAEGSGVVLLSYGFWQRHFGGEPSAVGSTMVLEGQPATVVGVLPRGLVFPAERDVWSPKWFRDYEAMDRSTGYMIAVGRLAPGTAFETAEADAARVAAALADAGPAPAAESAGIRLVPLAERALGDVRPALFVLLAAVGFLLLIACVNVASLLLAHGAARERELGIRVAHGAGRGRIVRQLLTEALLLAAIAGAAGVLLAYAGLGAIVRLAPAVLPRADTVALDAPVLLFSLAITCGSVVLFGLAPALRFSRPDVRSVLAAGGRTATPGRAGLRLRNVLVAGEVALALVLLVGAGLLGRSFAALLAVDPGFEARDRATVQVFLTDRNPEVAQRLARIDALLARYAALPGVASVAAVSALPFHPSQIDTEGEVQSDVASAEPVRAQTTIATPAYFASMGIPLRAGRDFGSADVAAAPRVAVLSETLARRLFGDASPIGRTVTAGVMGRPVEREVIGVVGDVRPARLDGATRAELYIPYAQSGVTSAILIAHAPGAAPALLPAMAEAVWELDPEQPVYHAATVEEMVGATLAERRFQLTLVGTFSAVALLLAAIGIYGLVSFATTRRTRELGVRLALGAGRGQLLGLVLRQGVLLAAAGVVAGLIASLAVTRFLTHMLFGVTPADPLTLASISAVMMLAALAAATVPALRAMRTEPTTALRAD